MELEIYREYCTKKWAWAADNAREMVDNQPQIIDNKSCSQT